MTAVDRQSGSPRVTVLMSVYNSGRFLAGAVESILGQTLTDFEFVIVDDGSTDGSHEILERYAAANSRIVLLANEANIGLTRSLNRGLEVARGRYLARQDADDISLPQRLAMQVEYLDRNLSTGLVCAGIEVMDQQGRTLARKIPPESDSRIKAELLIKNHVVWHTTVMVRLEEIRKAGGYDQSVRYAQDYDLWWRMGRFAVFGGLGEVLVRWRSNPESISSRNRQEQLECMFATSLMAVRESLGADEELNEEAYSRFWRAYHGFAGEMRGGEIECLAPLWKLLVERAELLPETLKNLERTVYYLLSAGKFAEGFRLAGVVRRMPSVRPRLGEMAASTLKGAVKAVLPGR